MIIKVLGATGAFMLGLSPWLDAGVPMSMCVFLNGLMLLLVSLFMWLGRK